MSEKRFIQSWNMHRGVHYYAIEDTQEKKMYCVEQSRGDVEKVVELLNKLSEEKEQLKKDKAILKERLREYGMKLDRFNCRW